eukprot:139481-Prymnesium_polylepis.1
MATAAPTSRFAPLPSLIRCDIEAASTPTTVTAMHSTPASPGRSPYRAQRIAIVNNGSRVLMMCVNDTDNMMRD